MMYELNKLIILIIIINIVWFVLDSLIPEGKKKDVFKGMAQVIITCLLCVNIINFITQIFSIDFSVSSLFTSSKEYQSISFNEYIDKYKEIILPFLK